MAALPLLQTLLSTPTYIPTDIGQVQSKLDAVDRQCGHVKSSKLTYKSQVGLLEITFRLLLESVNKRGLGWTALSNHNAWCVAWQRLEHVECSTARKQT